MSRKQTPPLTDDAQSQTARIRDDFFDRLNRLAEEIAVANKSEFVLKAHVHEALLTLKRAGLGPALSWYHRPGFKVGFGSMLVGLSPSIGGFTHSVLMNAAISEANQQNTGQNPPVVPMLDEAMPILFWGLVIALPIAVGVGGFCLAAYGWIQSGKAGHE